jgi:AraC-like DNA-binding protein
VLPGAPRCKIPVGLAAALGELGLSAAGVLAAARLPSRLLDPPGQRVSTPEYFALWRAIREVSGDPNVGLALATTVKPELTEPLLLAIMSAASVADALEVEAKYKRCLSPEVLAVRADAAARRVSLTYDWPLSAEPAPQVLVDVEIAFIVEICRRGTRRPDLAPRELLLRAAALEGGSTHAAFFRCPIRLGAAENGVVFDAEDAARPFVTFNPPLQSALLPYLQANTPPAAPSAVARIRGVIAERLRGQRPTVEAVSRELATSRRALQRLLKDNGTSFRRLLDEVRNEHARAYLRAASFNDAEIAFLLGFEDPNSFYRAFRSWNGAPPSEFRPRAGA